MSSTLALQPIAPFSYLHQRPAASISRDAGAGPVTPYLLLDEGKTKPSTESLGGLPTPPRSKAMTGVSLNHTQANGAGQQTLYPLRHPLQDLSNGGAAMSNRAASTYRHDDQDRVSGFWHGDSANVSRDFGFEPKKSSGNTIATSLQIPESINNSKGSLAEFAAEITCLFWFECAATLKYAEELVTVNYVERRLVPDAIPSTGFRKWVTTMLTTTLVGKNVILLALLFIYRLKKFNPGVSGKRGSEFRLLTIALMLGNKFLDDNTYTNKTWAEVSGISVNEIHIMEVEFLSNMRYNLYVSEDEWARWKTSLGRFGAFYEAASKMPSTDDAGSGNAPVTPSSYSPPHKLPSPPSTTHSTNTLARHQHPATNHPSLPSPFSVVSSLPRSPVRTYREHVSDRHSDRKRGLDVSDDLPPAKRMFTSASSSGASSLVQIPGSVIFTPGSNPTYTFNPVGPGELGAKPTRMPRLPVPKIQTTTNHQLAPSHPPQLAPINLPPARAMASVYTNPSNAWSQPTTPVNSMPPNMNVYSNPIPPLPHHSQTHSNYSSANVSPTGTSYSTTTPTRPGLSPSFFLTNRSSPYRPVRGVNTLLIPPPSASLHSQFRSIGHEQMQYQPLSKSMNERRPGPVPHLPHDGWSQNHNLGPHMTPHYPYQT